MNATKVFGLALAIMLASTSGLQAQRQTSMRPYRLKVDQASLRGQIQTLALGFKLAEQRFEAELKKLQTLEEWKGTKHLVAGKGRFAQQYRWCEASLVFPAITEVIPSYTDAIQSIMRRMDAGETWAPNEARAFIFDAQMALTFLNIHLAQQENIILAFRRQCIRAGDFPSVFIGVPKK
jgi:hypothetical protein